MEKDLNKLPKNDTRLVSKKVLNIIRMLKQFDTGKTFTVKELATELDVSEKTVYRYLKTLKAAYVPVQRDPVTLRYSFSDGYKVGISGEYEEDDIHLIGDTADDAIIMLEQDGRISYWNEYAKKLYGYKKYEVIGKDAVRLLSPKRFHKKNYEISAELFNDCYSSDLDATDEYVALKKNGEEFLVKVSFLSIIIKGKRKIIIIARETAMHTQKRAKRVSSDKHKKQEIFREQASDGVFIVDENNNVAYWNRSSENIFGYKKKDVIGKNIFKTILPKKSNKEYIEALNELTCKKNSMLVSKHVRLKAKKKDGSKLSLTVYLLFKKDKSKNGSFLIVRVSSFRVLTDS